MGNEINIQQKIQEFKQIYPEYKSYSESQIVSIMQEKGVIRLTDAQKCSLFSNTEIGTISDNVRFTNTSVPPKTVKLKSGDVGLKSSDGKFYNLNKTLAKKISSIESKLQNVEKNNGFMGSAWNWTKNTLGFGANSDRVRELISNEKNLLTQFNSNPDTRPQVFKELTGVEYTPESLEKFIKGEIKLKSDIALKDYQEGQEMASDITADIVSGIAAVGAIALAPVTGGASIVLAVGVGAGVKTGLKYADSRSAGRKYDSLTHDLLTGGVSGVLAPITAGLGGAVGKTVATKAGLQVMKQAGKETVEEVVTTGFRQTFKTALNSKGSYKYIGGTFKDRAKAWFAETTVSGASFGGVDGAFRETVDQVEKGNEIKVGEILEAGAAGTIMGAAGGVVVGGGFKAAGKAGSWLGEEIKEFSAKIPFGIVPKDVPQVVIPKKTTTNLYPESDLDKIEELKYFLREHAKGIETLNIKEDITGKGYYKKIEKKSTYTEGSYFITEYDGTYQIFKETQFGSNPGFWCEHVNSGDLYYFKVGNGQQNVVEHVSSQIYRAAGIDTPEMDLVAAPGFNRSVSLDNCWIRSLAIADLKPIYKNPEAAYEGFAVDAWLANWDAVCSENTLLKDGIAVRVDFGGSLNFRARGEKKAFGNKVPELSTLLDPNINSESAEVFSNMTREAFIKSLKRVQSVTPQELQNIYNSVRVFMNPELFITIKNRQKYLNYILYEAEKIDIKPNQTIREYVKTIEETVNKKYAKQIGKMNQDFEKRARVMNSMREQRDQVCSKEDLKSMWEYKSSSYTANTLIQKGEFDDPLVTSLEKALDKTTLTEDMVLFRGDHFIIDSHTNYRYKKLFPELDDCTLSRRVKTQYGFYSDPDAPLAGYKWENGEEVKIEVSSMEELIKRIYKKGRVVTEEQFVSTSVNSYAAKSFAGAETDIIYRYHTPKGTKAASLEKINIEESQGANVSGNLSGVLEGSEAEILLKRGFKYRMDNLTFEDGHYIIDCTIL